MASEDSDQTTRMQRLIWAFSEAHVKLLEMFSVCSEKVHCGSTWCMTSQYIVCSWHQRWLANKLLIKCCHESSMESRRLGFYKSVFFLSTTITPNETK